MPRIFEPEDQTMSCETQTKERPSGETHRHGGLCARLNTNHKLTNGYELNLNVITMMWIPT